MTELKFGPPNVEDSQIRTIPRAGCVLRNPVPYENPVQRFVDVTEDSDSFFPSQLAVNLKHSGEPKLEVIFHNHGAARFRRKNILLRGEPHIFRRELDFGDVGEIRQLRKTWIKIGVLR